MSVTSQVLRLHEAIYKASDGRLGHRMIGVPSLLLGTTGRRSGQPRTNALVYARDGDGYVVVASKGGGDRSPGWYFNALAAPEVEIQIARTRLPARARAVERGDPDYERLWAVANANNHARYDAYQTRTSRPIPLLVLTPTHRP